MYKFFPRKCIRRFAGKNLHLCRLHSPMADAKNTAVHYKPVYKHICKHTSWIENTMHVSEVLHIPFSLTNRGQIVFDDFVTLPLLLSFYLILHYALSN